MKNKLWIAALTVPLMFSACDKKETTTSEKMDAGADKISEGIKEMAAAAGDKADEAAAQAKAAADKAAADAKAAADKAAAAVQQAAADAKVKAQEAAAVTGDAAKDAMDGAEKAVDDAKAKLDGDPATQPAPAPAEKIEENPQ